MRRNVSLGEISDGRLYDLNDMVKADCGNCAGCSACCQGMGDSILLDPLDVYRLTLCLDRSFESLLSDCLELGVVDGIVLPHLKMTGKEERCVFLNEEGRCSIHPHRPGICRLFPLGRYYENSSFRYFLQTGECRNTNRTKVKVSKWIDTPQIRGNQKFIADWHYFLKDMEDKVQEAAARGDDLAKNLNLYLLNTFFVTPYEREASFYGQVAGRMSRAKQEICNLTEDIH